MSKNQGSEDGEAPPSGWESVADWFRQYSATSTVGATAVQEWVLTLPPRGTVLDVGCGSGSPRSEALARRGLSVYAIDASPSLAAAYSQRFPEAQVACEAVEASALFGVRFDGVLAWGVIFLLPPDEQRRVLGRLVEVLKPGGKLLFTAPGKRCTWRDASTGQASWSLGAENYESLLAGVDATVIAEFEDEGQNHYYLVQKHSGP